MLKLKSLILSIFILSTGMVFAADDIDDLYDRLFSRIQIAQDQKNIIRANVSKLSVEDQKSVLTETLRIVQAEEKAKFIKFVVETLSGINIDQRNNYINQYLRLVQEEFSTKDKTDLLKILVKKIDCLELFVNKCLQVSRGLEGGDLVKLVKFLSGLSLEELESMTENINKIVLPDDEVIFDNLTLRVARGLKKIVPSQRNGVIDLAGSLLSNDAPGDVKLSLIKCLTDIPAEKRIYITDQLKKVLQITTLPNEDKNSLCLALFREFAKKDFMDIEYMINKIIEISPPDMINNCSHLLINSLYKVQKDNHQELIQQTLKICPKNEFFPNFLFILSCVDSAKWEQLTSKILEHFSNYSENDKLPLLAILVNVDETDYDDVINKSNIPGITEESRILFLHAISSVAKEERDLFIRETGTITEGLVGKEKYAAIYALASCKSEDRIPFITQYRRLAPILETITENEKFIILNIFMTSCMNEAKTSIEVSEVEARVTRLLGDRLPEDTVRRYINVLSTQSDEPLPPRHDEFDDDQVEGFAEGIDVHAGNRDSYVTEALNLFIRDQDANNINLSNTLAAYSELTAYIQNFIGQEMQDKINLVLKNSSGRRGFGGFEDANIRIERSNINGKSLLGRLWLFAQYYKNGLEFEEIKDSIISALGRCIEDDGTVVCDPGKLQRLVVAVLQGRLEGVNVDRDAEITDAYLSQLFFTPQRQEMTGEQLRSEIGLFLSEHNNVTRERLERLVEGYIAHSDL